MNLPSHMTKLGSLKPADGVVTAVPQADWDESDSDSPSFVANKPTAMRSPAALSFGSKTYDGSAAATVTAADLGALTAHQDISGKVDSSALFSGGKVKPELLPSYVDDVLEYPSLVGFPSAGEAGKIYVAKDTNKIYRWSGTQYVEVSPAPTVDSALSGNSTNPVQNKVVTSALNGKATSAQGAKADAALSRAEAEAGFTVWVWGDGVNRGQPEWDAENNRWSLDGGVYVSHSDVSSEDDVVLPTLYTIEEDEPMPWTATRTRLPTMADIPTDNAQLTNGAGYATTAAMTAALALKADAASLPYALVDVTPTAGAPFVLAACFPIVYTIDGQSITITASSVENLQIVFEKFNQYYYIYDGGGLIFSTDRNGVYLDIGEAESITFNGTAPTANTTQVFGFTPTYALADRASSAVSLTADATLAFPAKTAGKARDFVVRLTLTETNNVVPSVTFPADVAYETEGGEWPDLSAAGTYIVRLTEVPAASESETARFFLQCSSAVEDATPPSAGGGQ